MQNSNVLEELKKKLNERLIDVPKLNPHDLEIWMRGYVECSTSVDSIIHELEESNETNKNS